MPDTGQAGPAPQDRVWRFGTAEYDEARRELRVGGEPRTVEAKPLALLRELLLRAGEVAPKHELLAAVWPGVTVEQSLTTAIAKLRTALGEQGRTVIESVHGIGYRIAVPIELRAAPAKSRHAFGFQPGDAVPNRPQWKLERLLGGHHTTRDVWLAQHEKTGERRVFKFADTTERLEALKREAALSRILYDAIGDRPDLLRISEWSFESRPFFIESPYGGDSLPDWAASRGGIAAVPLAERIAIVARIARTAAAAHDIGVLHRDIKPGNVLMSGDGEGLAIRLVDFGSGRLTEAARIEAVTIAGLGLTAAGAQGGTSLSGTLRYMAPEIITGGPATIAADVFSLGILLYQMIVGDLDRPLTAGWEADVPDPLLREDVREAASGDPARRLASALMLAERLEGLDARRAEQARLSRLEEDSGRLARQADRARTRRPWLILGIASLAAGLLGTTVFAVRAVRARDEALHQASIARQVNSFLTDDLLGRGDPTKSGKANETLMEAASKAEPRIAERFAHEPLVAASVYAALAEAFSQRTATTEARVAYDRAVDFYNQAEGANSADATILRLRQASMEITLADAGSIDRAKTIIHASQQAIGTFGSRVGEALGWLLGTEGTLRLMGGDMQSAQREFTVAADLADAMPDRFDTHTRFALRQREAFADLRLGRWPEADRLLSVLLSQEMKLNGPRHPDTLMVRLTQATLLMVSGKPAEAIQIIDGMIADMTSAYGPDHRLTLQAYATRAESEGLIERYDDAVRDDTIVYKASLAKQGSHAFYTFATLSDLATSECRGDHPDAGLPHALQSLDDAKATVGEKNGVIQTISAGPVALCLVLDKQYARAAQYLNGIDLKATSEFTADPDEPASISLMQAAIAAGTGDRVHARELLRLPLQAYGKPDSDKFYHRWAEDLNRSLSAAN